MPCTFMPRLNHRKVKSNSIRVEMEFSVFQSGVPLIISKSPGVAKQEEKKEELRVERERKERAACWKTARSEITLCRSKRSVRFARTSRSGRVRACVPSCTRIRASRPPVEKIAGGIPTPARTAINHKISVNGVAVERERGRASLSLCSFTQYRAGREHERSYVDSKYVLRGTHVHTRRGMSKKRGEVAPGATGCAAWPRDLPAGRSRIQHTDEQYP